MQLGQPGKGILVDVRDTVVRQVAEMLEVGSISKHDLNYRICKNGRPVNVSANTKEIELPPSQLRSVRNRG